MAIIYLFEQEQEFYLRGLFQQHYHDYECDLVVQLSHMQFNQLMFNQVRIEQQMAITYLSVRVLLGFCSMGRFQQRHRDCGYGLVVRLNHMQSDQLMFSLGHI